MAVLDQEFGDLHRVQRAKGGAVAKAFAREGARVLLERTQWRSTTVDALDETAIERNVAEVARATAAFGPKARAALRTRAFARTRSPSCAIAMPRSASAGSSSRRATRCNAPRGSPAASARAAAVISESIGIPPHLSLPPFEGPALNISHDHQPPGHISSESDGPRELIRLRHTHVPNCACRARTGNVGRCRARAKGVRGEFERLSHREALAGVTTL